MSRILIVDDDDQLRKSFEKLLAGEGYSVVAAASGEAGEQIVRKGGIDLVIMDVRLPGMDGLTAFKLIHEIEPRLPVIIMTAYGTTETAIEATKLGAFDFILKPFDIPEILEVINKALEAGRFMRSHVDLNPESALPDSEAIIGTSRAMQEVYKAIGKVSPTDATVLIRGESGTGKELVARAIYHHSLRCTRPFLVINCVAIPETLLESELFGYEKGAFTGAAHRKTGKIEQADGGTVFLDEIGDMPLAVQGKILRLLQEKTFERLGGRETISVDVRIIAATNRDLEKALAEGRFREDLYYRLKVVTVGLPPLRERAGDLRILAEYFLARHCATMGIENPGIKDDALALLEAYSWPGNVRELGNTIHKALIFNRGAPISREDLIPAIRTGEGGRKGTEPEEDPALLRWIRNTLATQDRDDLFEYCTEMFASCLIEEALRLSGGNRSKAAKMLGISRPTLHAKIDKYRIRFETSVLKE